LAPFVAHFTTCRTSRERYLRTTSLGREESNTEVEPEKAYRLDNDGRTNCIITMGSESSKPVQPPEQWDRKVNQFLIDSPMSDLSNPSDIHKLHRARVPNQDRNRRTSRTITKSLADHHQPKQLPPPSAFYFPTKETERYEERASKRSGEGNKGKENDKAKGNFKKIIKKSQKALTGCFTDNNEQLEREQMEREQRQCRVHPSKTEENEQPEMEQMEREQRQSRVHTSKTKEASSRGGKSKSQPEQRRVSDFDAPAEASKEHHRMSFDGRRSSVSDAADRSTREKQSANRDEKQPSIQKILASTENTFVIREAEGLVMPEEYMESVVQTGNSATIGASEMALHHEDAYFARLIGEAGRYSDVQESPCVANDNKTLHNFPSTDDNYVQSAQSVLDSPGSILSSDEDEDKETTLSKTVESIIGSSVAENEKRCSSGRVSTSSSNSKATEDHSSFVSSHLHYQSHIGQIAETPGAYSDDEEKSVAVFFDESYKSSESEKHQKIAAQKETDAIEKRAEHVLYDENGTDEDSTVLSYFKPGEKNTNSAFRFRTSLPEEPLKQVATLGPSNRKNSAPKISKLETLFRPVLPALSSDDAQTVTSYDPFEIKVTESAPGAVESTDYRALALRNSYGSPESMNVSKFNKLGSFISPSMVSIDSQINQSPAMTSVMVSDQARCNGDFLFTSEYGKQMLTQRPARSGRDSAILSISTIGARSRLTQRSSRSKAVHIPVKSSQSVASEDTSRTSEDDRHVRFSLIDAVSASNLSMVSSTSSTRTGEAIDAPAIESKMSDLTDNFGDYGSRASTGSPKSHIQKASIPEEEAHDDIEEESSEKNEPSEDTGSPNRVQWASYTTTDGDVAVTPHLKGKNINNVTNSPYLRFQSAQSRFQSHSAREGTDESIDGPAIESKVSDLTDNLSDFRGRSSVESAKADIVRDAIPKESASETSETVSGSPDMQVHWSYSMKDGEPSGVTPHLKGKELKNATNSPYLRFASAKTKFANPGKELPIKNPRNTTKAKRSSSHGKKSRVARKSGAGGVVSGRIEVLNQKVINAKIDRKKHRWTVTNPRKYSMVDSNAIRTQAIVNYRTNLVGIEKFNMGAAKFNKIPLDDDSSVDSSVVSSNADYADRQEWNRQNASPEHDGLYYHTEVAEERKNDEYEIGDDMSKLSVGSTSVATVRQEKQTDFPRYNARVSESSHSTSSSGLSIVRKQVFRKSGSLEVTSRPSVSSYGESTTMSSILKNATYLPFREEAKTVKPTEQHIVAAPESLHLSHTQRTPMQARTWRSLAAAAKERDSQKKPTGSKARKGLSVRNTNTAALA
jgi:hypothetical protein